MDDQDYRSLSNDPIESLIPELGIFAKAVNSTVTLRNDLRSKTGIYVFAATAGTKESGTGLAPGDVITSFNGRPVVSMQELRGAITELASGKPAVVQIERNGLFLYLEQDVEKSGLLSVDPSRGRR